MTTIQDVARLAGVSPVTVSRVINGASNVNVETRARVEQVIQELSYVPNRSARSLRSRQTFTLALVLPDITNAFWTTIVRGVEDAAQNEGYSVLLCNSDENLSKQTDYIHTVLQQRVDGVIIAPYDSDPVHLGRIQELKIPTVLVDRWVDGLEVDSVRSDSLAGAYALTRHLLSVGHRRIAMISGPTSTSTGEERIAGWALALDQAGLPVEPGMAVRGEFRVHSGRTMAEKLLAEGPLPDAIIAANNVLAVGVLDVLQKRGLRIPQDIALVCYDELPDLARFHPFLTVAMQPAYEIGVNAGQLLLSRIKDGEALHPRHVLLPVHLKLRYSCGRFLAHGAGQAESTIPRSPDFSQGLIRDETESVLVQPLNQDEMDALARLMPRLQVSMPMLGGWHERSGAPSASQVFRERLQAGNRLHIEERVGSKRLLEYVLQRTIPLNAGDLSGGRVEAAPADAIEFAWRLGIASVPCELDWLPAGDWPEGGQLPTGWADLENQMQQLMAPPAMAACIDKLEGYLRAAHGSRVGVYASLGGFVEPALHLARAASTGQDAASRRAALERMLDLALAYQKPVIQALCDRFGRELDFLVLRDILPTQAEDDFDLHALLLPRLRVLAGWVREHRLVLGLRAAGALEGWMPWIVDAGFELVQGVDPLQNDLAGLVQAWGERVVFIGGFPVQRLVEGSLKEIEDQVRDLCARFPRGPQAACGPNAAFGLIFGVGGRVDAEIRPELFMRMSRTLQEFQG